MYTRNVLHKMHCVSHGRMRITRFNELRSLFKTARNSPAFTCVPAQIESSWRSRMQTTKNPTNDGSLTAIFHSSSQPTSVVLSRGRRCRYVRAVRT
jgi:hypothetical protein